MEVFESALVGYKLSRVAVGTKMVTKLYIVFVWTDLQERFKTEATFGRGFFEKGLGKKISNSPFSKMWTGS